MLSSRTAQRCAPAATPSSAIVIGRDGWAELDAARTDKRVKPCQALALARGNVLLAEMAWQEARAPLVAFGVKLVRRLYEASAQI